MRKKDVIELLNHASIDLRKIEQQYNRAINEKEVPASLRIDIKNLMENLRSVLDYITHDIYEAVVKPQRDMSGKKIIKKIYFPYGRSKKEFGDMLNSNLPQIELLNPGMAKLLESIQGYVCNSDWLYQFISIVNEKKHNNLTPQKREDRRVMKASVGNASVSIPINNPNIRIFQSPNASVTIGGVPVRLSDQGIEPLAPGLTRKITTWVSFKFIGTEIQVLPLLKKALREILKLSENVYEELQSIS